MSEKALPEEEQRQEMAAAVDSCLKIISEAGESPQEVATVVGNIVANIAGIFARKYGVEQGAEIHAAINCISSRSIDMYLKDSKLDVDAYHDFYMQCLITIAGSLSEGVLIKPEQRREGDD
jgi:hypothetical protein